MLRHLAEAERTRSPAPVPRSWLWLGSSVLLQGGRGQLSVLPSSRIAGTEILLGLVTDAFGDFVRNNLRGHHRMQWIQGRMREDETCLLTDDHPSGISPHPSANELPAWTLAVCSPRS